MRDLEITPKLAKVLKVFLEDPGRPRYGFELMRLTDLASGSLYPMLARLEEAGWLTKGKEDIDPHVAGRPPRLHYTIVGAAVTAARLQLAALRAIPAARPGTPPPAGRHRMSDFVWVVLAFVGGLGVTVIGDMVSEEVRDRLDHIPHAILKLAAGRLDSGQRFTVYKDEWLPELTYILKGAQARPITRLITGTHYALGILVNAHRIARHLHRSVPAQPALTGATALPPVKAFHQLEQFVKAHEIRHAVLLHADGTPSDQVLDAILRKNGATAELFIGHEESAEAIGSERQPNVIRSSTETETVPGASAFKVYEFRMPVPMRAILIDDKLLCAGWCTFETKDRHGKLMFRNDPAGKASPVLLVWSGTEGFEMLRSLIESLAASYREMQDAAPGDDHRRSLSWRGGLSR